MSAPVRAAGTAVHDRQLRAFPRRSVTSRRTLTVIFTRPPRPRRGSSRPSSGRSPPTAVGACALRGMRRSPPSSSRRPLEPAAGRWDRPDRWSRLESARRARGHGAATSAVRVRRRADGGSDRFGPAQPPASPSQSSWEICRHITHGHARRRPHRRGHTRHRPPRVGWWATSGYRSAARARRSWPAASSDSSRDHTRCTNCWVRRVRRATAQVAGASVSVGSW